MRQSHLISIGIISYVSALSNDMHTMEISAGLSKRQANSSQCFQLQNSVACPAHNGAYISQTSFFSDIQSFDKFMIGSLDNQTDSINTFQSYYDCKTFNGTGTRYHLTVLCSQFYDASKSVCSAPTKPILPLCKDTCYQAQLSIQQVFQNSRICSASPSTNILTLRKTTLDDIFKYCDQQSARNNTFVSGSCLDGREQSFYSKTCGKLHVSHLNM